MTTYSELPETLNILERTLAQSCLYYNRWYHYEEHLSIDCTYDIPTGNGWRILVNFNGAPIAFGHGTTLENAVKHLEFKNAFLTSLAQHVQGNSLKAVPE